MSLRHIVAFVALSTLSAARLGRRAAPAAADKAGPVDFQWGVKIPLRDGVKLNATLYRPQGQKEALPCVFTLTPYISQSYHDRGMYFAGHGYVFLTVDVRGRGNSEGEFTPMLQEAKDGHDVVEWLAQQSVLQRQGDDVGWLLRRLRPVGDGEGIPAASGDDRAGRIAVCRRRFSPPQQHRLSVRRAVADVHQRPRRPGKNFRRQRRSGRRSSRNCICGHRAFKDLDSDRRQSFAGVSRTGSRIRWSMRTGTATTRARSSTRRSTCRS